ncbi:gentisate 1,2-dioxygenase [Rhizorhabdus wittichii DC-6]|jgi:gentisate 1,2-dioxygenase|uniref:Gentisate 1,2-dioxygenase n=2 Tax=Rhizorhabdus wittichii TaxID=160791 RepID=A0A9J9LEM7_RHIWR|nr:gentisate 1,2-dioxygenase [Rhizorhabdus wittichii RW1]ARR53784.1 gentisate 1,2-dioxygenase [Rhizorhabdus wittichii DC-6]
MEAETAPETMAAFYAELDGQNMAPLWESLHSLVPRQPAPVIQAAHWDYDAVVRPRLMEAGRLITAKKAERRVLILENPGLRGKASITQSLYAGLQLILPGEVAPAHRHTQCALRFIVEGEGAHTTVSGERTIMHPGDFVLTPNWTWHDHGNESDAPMVWLDGLDIPIVAFLDAGFAEAGNADSQPTVRPDGDAEARFGGTLLPVDWRASSRNSPVLNYPYARSRETLHRLERNGEADASHGYKLRYVNPADGGWPMPTIGAFIQFLPGGFRTAPYRSTDSTVYAVVEGHGESIVGDRRIRWKPRDIFVAPSWQWQEHAASGDAVLFSFSDRPVQEGLGLWREERGIPRR